jgi:hypothetical protein
MGRTAPAVGVVARLGGTDGALRRQHRLSIPAEFGGRSGRSGVKNREERVVVLNAITRLAT